MLIRRLTVACGMVLGLLAADFDSAALAGFLRDGVRPGAPGTPGFLRPPPPGTPVRIRPPGAARGEPTTAAPGSRQARHGWFWEAHSPALTAAGAGRWAEALATVRARRARGRALFEAGTIRAIRAAWGAEVRAAARARNLSETLLLAVIAVESGGQPRALSPKGAQGLMQLIPATAARFGVSDPFEPAANIAGGAAYLDWLLAEFRGDILLALAAYNAGETAVRRHGGVPPYAETRDYVVRVLDAIAAGASLCDEPPSGPRLPCRWKPEI
ncbi:MAG TPA: lytic transglycosylase domain-containing protein [Paracoccaceae bacterium]|nr:lytic transglycosylase domain-containing protein [Paracoccaceae bacterium]